MKTKEQLELNYKNYLTEKTERINKYQLKCSKYKRKIIIAMALVFLINYAVIGVAFKISWYGYIYSLGIGGLVGYLIWLFNRGIFIGMTISGMIGVLGLVILDLMRGINLCAVGLAAGMGSLMILIFSIAGWVIVGGFAGYLRVTFDHDNIQI